MPLPLVSRGRYDDMREERDRLVAERDDLVDTLKRIARKAEGLTEVQPERRRKPKAPPSKVRDAINAWDSPASRMMAERKARQMMRRDDVSPGEIVEAVGPIGEAE